MSDNKELNNAIAYELRSYLSRAKNPLTECQFNLIAGYLLPFFSDYQKQIESLQAQLNNMTASYIKAMAELNDAGDVINYPDEWDTACYDTLKSALDHYNHCADVSTVMLAERDSQLTQLQQRNDDLEKDIRSISGMLTVNNTLIDDDTVRDRSIDLTRELYFLSEPPVINKEKDSE